MRRNKTISFISTSQGGRYADLQGLITSIQNFEGCEFIFLDQNPNDNKFVPLFFLDKKINFIHIKSNEKMSLSRARNIAIKRATKDLVVFCDDDAQYKETFCFDVNKVFDESGESSVYIAKVLEIGTERPYGNRKYPSYEKVLSIHDVMNLGLSLSIIIKRALLEKLDGFDERLGVGTGLGCGEESDLLLRCLSLYALVVYTPLISIFHPAFVNSDSNNYLKVRSYAKGYGYICMKIYPSLKLMLLLRLHYLNLLGRTVVGIIFSSNRKMYCYRLFGLIDRSIFFRHGKNA